jgi:SAM-dependent methyltransferase
VTTYLYRYAESTHLCQKDIEKGRGWHIINHLLTLYSNSRVVSSLPAVVGYILRCLVVVSLNKLRNSSTSLNSMVLLLLLLSGLISVVTSFSATVRRQPIGRIPSLDRSKLDNTGDTNFYSQPNFVTHTDDVFLQRLTELYDKVLPEDSILLDIMASHVSHLPAGMTLERVDLHGMNPDELDRNPARQATQGAAFVRDLNANPSLIGLCDDTTYDAVLCCVGIQYLEEPEAVFAELARVLKPNGVVVISFTNRFFYQKALQGWIERGMKERARLVQDYLRAAGGFQDIEIVGDGTSVWTQLKSIGGLGGGDPFVAVVAKRSNE